METLEAIASPDNVRETEVKKRIVGKICAQRAYRVSPISRHPFESLFVEFRLSTAEIFLRKTLSNLSLVERQGSNCSVSKQEWQR